MKYGWRKSFSPFPVLAHFYGSVKKNLLEKVLPLLGKLKETDIGLRILSGSVQQVARILAPPFVSSTGRWGYHHHVVGFPGEVPHQA